MPFDVVCTVHRCMERRVRQMASRTPSNGETEQASSKGPYLNDVYKIFWFFDPLPPLSAIV